MASRVTDHKKPAAIGDRHASLQVGPIADRTKEHLSSSDVAIIHARRLTLDALA
jgi:hypothetical protein